MAQNSHGPEPCYQTRREWGRPATLSRLLSSQTLRYSWIPLTGHLTGSECGIYSGLMTATDLEPRTLFVFMDESGDMQFTAKGKQHFVLSAVCTEHPGESAQAMQRLKYNLLAKGSEDLEFHATSNTKGTRHRVVDVVRSLNAIRVHSIWIDKRMTAPSMQDEVKLLGLFGAAMGRWVHNTVASPYSKIILIFDSVLTGQKQKAVVKNLKQTLAPLEKEVRVCFHPVKQDLNGQIADYYSWALFRALESGDYDTMRQLQSGTPTWDGFNMFESGHTIYWRK